jgi:hypothetical protein
LFPQVKTLSAAQSDFGSVDTEAFTQFLPSELITWQAGHKETEAQTFPFWACKQCALVQSASAEHVAPKAFVVIIVVQAPAVQVFPVPQSDFGSVESEAFTQSVPTRFATLQAPHDETEAQIFFVCDCIQCPLVQFVSLEQSAASGFVVTTQAPAVQTLPAAHAVPQIPQLVLLV